MEQDTLPTIWTIGHSNRPVEVLEALLLENGIQLLVDVRSIPHSRFNPQFNKNRFTVSLWRIDMGYIHLPALGGRLQILPNQPEEPTGKPFGAYAEYMKTSTFRHGLNTLKAAASHYRTAYMCAEKPWRNCHRSMISEQLKQDGWQVIHIVDKGVVEAHPNDFGVEKQSRLF